MIKKLFFTRNVGKWDRLLRTVPAILTAIAWFAGSISGVTAIVLAIISGMLFLTSVTGTCSIYSALGISTLKNSAGENSTL